ncbi:DUF2336 domain-containing protein [Rhizobiaceae bacterium]|nr:DUF2336 domain-containing protein [Rhizobiaceae bacterium]
MFVEEFLAWSRGATVTERATAIADLAAMFVDDALDSGDRQDSEAVFAHMMDDGSIEVRAALSNALAGCDDIPPAVLWGLLDDVAEVAAPLLQEDPTLRAADLIDLLTRVCETGQTAIATRHDLDGSVVRAIVSEGCADANLALLNNESLALGPGLKDELADRFADDCQLRGALLACADLTAATRDKLARALGEGLTLLAGRLGADTVQTRHAAKDAANRASIDIAMTTPLEQLPDFVEHLVYTGRMTPSLLVRAAAAGQAAFVEHTFALLSGMALGRVQSICDRGAGPSFDALYARTGLPQPQLVVHAAAVSLWPLDSNRLASDMLDVVRHEPDLDGATLALLSRIALEQLRDRTFVPQMMLEYTPIQMAA